MTDQAKLAQDTIDEIEERRAKKRKERDAAEAEQFAIDLEALEALEDEHGIGVIGSVKTARFVPGLTTRVFFKPPTEAQYNRYTEQYGRATDKKSTGGQRDALKLLAQSCWVYPKEDEIRKALVEAFPGLLVSVGLEVAKAGEAERAEEGKG